MAAWAKVVAEYREKWTAPGIQYTLTGRQSCSYEQNL